MSAISLYLPVRSGIGGDASRQRRRGILPRRFNAFVPIPKWM